MRVSVDPIKASYSKVKAQTAKAFERVTLENVSTPFGGIDTSLFVFYDDDSSQVFYDDNTNVEYEV